MPRNINRAISFIYHPVNILLISIGQYTLLYCYRPGNNMDRYLSYMMNCYCPGIIFYITHAQWYDLTRPGNIFFHCFIYRMKCMKKRYPPFLYQLINRLGQNGKVMPVLFGLRAHVSNPRAIFTLIGRLFFKQYVIHIYIARCT